ncbi:MAG: HAD family hydrolase [Clostridiales bacterium]|nr:HAD family hydrolase [Clostridiales bacterium]
MNFQTILFDLDGTLTDPGIGITNSVMYALQKYGITVNDRSELYKFIGPPLWESFERYYGFSEAEAKKAVAYYREHFSVTGMFENTVYDGIDATLAALEDAGKTLLVATSKPEVFAEQILQHFDLAKYFDFIGGSELDGSRVNKNDVIRYTLEMSGVTDLSTAVMVGDREHDILGAKKVGITSVGVLFGYGSREELEAAGADFIAETVNDLHRILRG